MRIVLDTNIIVRAADKSATLAIELLDLALTKPNALILSHPLFAEIEKVLRYPRVRKLHRLNESQIEDFLELLVAGSEQTALPAYPVGPLVGLDPKDDMVLLTATAGGADVLGTNNRHFFTPDVLQYAATHGVRIVRDIELIAELRRA